MTGNTKALQQLERVARLKSDIEMRRFSAFRAHLMAARDKVGRLSDELEAVYRTDQSFSVPEARLMNALAGQKSRMLIKAEAELDRLLPGFEVARQNAVRAFGRAEALDELRHLSSREEAQARAKRATDGCQLQEQGPLGPGKSS